MSAALPPVDNTIGAALIGVICAAVLYGISCTQMLYYYLHYPKDKRKFKIFVACVWGLDTVHQALIGHTVYFYAVTHYAEPTVLGDLVWSVLLEVLFNSLIGLAVQCFLAMRLWKLSEGNVFLSVVVMLATLGGFACSLVFTAKSLRLATWKDLGSLKALSMSVNVMTVVPDVMLALGLTWYLQASKTGFRRSNTVISRLIMFTVSTGILTSICAIASLASILIWGDALIYVAFYFCLGRLYSNSLLATLNARNNIRSGSTELEWESFSLSGIGESRFTGSGSNQASNGSQSKTGHHIHFKTPTEFESDDGSLIDGNRIVIGVTKQTETTTEPV